MITHTLEHLPPQRSVAEFRDWLRHEIGKCTDLPLGEVDFTRSIHALGMSSVHVVRLAGEIEELLSIEVEPTAFYEFDSVDELCDELLAMHVRRKRRDAQNASPSPTLIVAATFTAAPLGDALQFLLKHLGLPAEVTLAPYNQVLAELRNPQGLIGSARQGMAALVIRLEDLLRTNAKLATPQAASARVHALLDALRAAAHSSHIPLFLTLAPHSPQAVSRLGLSNQMAALDQTLLEGVSDLPQVHVIDLRHIDQSYDLTTLVDDARDARGHIPFTPPCFTALAAEIVRRYAALTVGPASIIERDGDTRGGAQVATSLKMIAHAGRDIHSLTQQILRTGSNQRPALPTEYATPRTVWEQRLCAIWRTVLQIDPIGIHDDFYALGGNADTAAKVLERSWELGAPKTISLQSGEAPTIAHLARAIEVARTGDRPSLPSAGYRLADEGPLDQNISIPGSDPSTYDTPMQRVLLTGATGYLGAFLLHELLQQTQAHILCLVRANSSEDGLARVLTNLRKYQLETPDASARLSVVPGDMSEPRLGLEPARFAALAADIDTILHSAASVNFVHPYLHLKASNVDATEHLLRLACADAPRRIQFHYVSTLGVVMSNGYDRKTPILETSPLLHGEDLLNGYEQSKYVSDKMVWTAFQERGIPGAIYRPPLISGLSDGTYHKLDEFLPQVFKGCLQLQCFPALDSLWEVAPIDFVSKSIVHIARAPKNLNRAYFITHPDSRSVSDYIDWYQRVGFVLRAVPWEIWKKEFLGLGPEIIRKNALAPFVDFIEAMSQAQVFFPLVDSRQFREAIRDLAIVPPPALTLLERYTRHFIDSGFYDDLADMPAALRKPSV